MDSWVILCDARSRTNIEVPQLRFRVAGEIGNKVRVTRTISRRHQQIYLRDDSCCLLFFGFESGERVDENWKTYISQLRMAISCWQIVCMTSPCSVTRKPPCMDGRLRLMASAKGLPDQHFHARETMSIEYLLILLHHQTS